MHRSVIAIAPDFSQPGDSISLALHDQTKAVASLPTPTFPYQNTSLLPYPAPFTLHRRLHLHTPLHPLTLPVPL